MGFPVAVQIMAPVGADALALRAAYALEQAAPEHRVQVLLDRCGSMRPRRGRSDMP